MIRILVAFCLALLSWSAAQAQGTVVPHTCSQAILLTQGSSGTSPLVGPGAAVPTWMPTGGQAAALLTSGAGIQICGYTVNVATAGTAGLEYGPGATCSQVSPTINPTPLTPNWSLPVTGALTDNADYFRGLYVPPGQTLCLVSSVVASVIVYYNNLGPQ